MGIQLKGIYVDTPLARKLINLVPKNYNVVFVSPKNYSWPVDMLIADDKVGYFLRKGKWGVTTIVIESPEVSAAMKSMFDIAFENAKTKGGRYLTDE